MEEKKRSGGLTLCDGLDPAFRLQALPPVPVKGKSEPVATFAVLGYDGQA